MFQIEYTNRFKKSLKKCAKRGLDIEKLREAINLLATDGCLPKIYKAHKLTGNYSGKWECHIEPDWLLIWEQNDEILRLLMIETGSHSDIFG